MISRITEETLRNLVANIYDVKGEKKLFEKLQPWFISAYHWLNTNLLDGYTPGVGTTAEFFALKAIIYKAFVDAIPSLDLSITSGGMAVINSEGRAPASKERVERLIASLRKEANENVILLQMDLMANSEWRETLKARAYNLTFMPFLQQYREFDANDNIFEAYHNTISLVAEFESWLVIDYLGEELADALRSGSPLPGSTKVVNAIIASAKKYVHMEREERGSGVQDQAVAILVAPILRAIRTASKEIYNLWYNGVGRAIETPTPSVKKQGGFWV